MLNEKPLLAPEGLRFKINEAYRQQESVIVTELIEQASLNETTNLAIQKVAVSLVEAVRAARKKTAGIDSFLTQYTLSSEEGIALMCLAEALLRVPDNATIDQLIKDKLSTPDWKAHQGQSNSFFVNATTWALMLTGNILTPEKAQSTLNQVLLKWVGRTSEGVVRKAVNTAMRIMGKQFVMGRTIEEALQRAEKKEAKGYRYSYDMLGEAALTEKDASRYFDAYAKAIEAIGAHSELNDSLYRKAGVSVKLSALHPRYQEAQRNRVLNELVPSVLALAELAKKHNIAMTIDAEESERLDLSLDVIERVFSDNKLVGWNGFGLAVQSYQKRAFYVLDWVADLARKNNRRMMVRLIKGAYWDSEIKKTQMQGLVDYPVFTRKVFTDVSFQACAKKLFTLTDVIYPQFATHNAYSVAMVLKLAGDYKDFEFQCLHGMGNELYEQVVPAARFNIPCRIYAPVGSHEDLLPYLVRRLLENGANSSFVNRIVDEQVSIEQLTNDPVHKAQSLLTSINQNIPLPANIFLPIRKNASGLDLSDRTVLVDLESKLKQLKATWHAAPIIEGESHPKETLTVFSPQAIKQAIGEVSEASLDDVEKALESAENGFSEWGHTTVEKRTSILMRFASLLEENYTELLSMLCLEAGKTFSDAIGEVREAIDFCYYYASMSETLFAHPITLQGYTGELNQLSLHPRGVVLCISPWNFPLAIFTGQIVAALVTGNTVIAKPAEQTPLIAAFTVNLMLKAGFPVNSIQLLPGPGETIGAKLVADRRVKAVIFTGSTATANHINQALATRGGEIVPLIAETGGQNAMIVDSSALLEQVVVDALTSAFGSAGQRCSALRVIYVQEEVCPRFIELMSGAMAELKLGHPQWLTTDVGPVIDKDALSMLETHVSDMQAAGYEVLMQSPLPHHADGYFMPPTLIRIDHINALKKEVFGPILHIVSYQRDHLDDVIHQINNTGYGLTLGIHSRINETVKYIQKRVAVGNCYINRNMIGAVVGLQPFGGEGLSGTGPKAGGPLYLQRLCVERTFTVDTTAAGGNASLMSMTQDE